MIIKHFNKQHFKFQLGDLTLAINPVSKGSEEKSNKYTTDVVLETINHPDYNGGTEMDYNGKEPFVISGPGEYEVKGIFIKGFGTQVELPIANKNKKEKQLFQNTSYLFTMDGINICFLGCLKEELTSEHRKLLDEVDILFVPVSSDDYILNAYEANKIATQLEPKLVVPMDYDKKSLAQFLEEIGADEKKLSREEKITVKKKDIEDKKSEIVLFNI